VFLSADTSSQSARLGLSPFRAPAATRRLMLKRPIQRRPVRSGLAAGDNVDGFHPSLVNTNLCLAQRAQRTQRKGGFYAIRWAVFNNRRLPMLHSEPCKSGSKRIIMNAACRLRRTGRPSGRCPASSKGRNGTGDIVNANRDKQNRLARKGRQS
jgi:hypothetical protein